ncbi:CDP-diacylglycerol--glycerol-3-phosphate 3-phosphatidyltransferase [Candidatus Woesearchaeota archaeon]|nr:CDP-diacylglycerol--glycerol-3-phosphate 3-phosphatidyltransferase [Candidatus Woesearchaeota archaeon]
MQFKFNVPNKITIIRVALIPLFAVVLLANIPYRNWLAAVIFGMLSISDILDGYFARKKKQVTEFGKLIDPIADKLLISTALVFLIGKGVEFWMVAVIISREAILTAIRIYLLPARLVVPASNLGKLKTVVQSLAIISVLLGFSISWHVMVAAVILTILSGIEYLFEIRKLTGNKVVNLPNLITLTRFLLIIPFVYYFIQQRIDVSLIILAVITLSDKLDGISARIMNQMTELGSGFDSFTDWAVIITTLMLFLVQGYIKNVFLVVLLLVPPIISGAMKMIYAKRLKKVPVTFIAKISVAMIYVTFIVILVKLTYNVNILNQLINYLYIAILVLVYLTMFGYIFKAMSLKKNSA